MAFNYESYHREKAMEAARNVGMPILVEGGVDFGTKTHANRFNYEWWLAKMGLGFESKKINGGRDLLFRAVIPNAKQQRRVKKVLTHGGAYAKPKRKK